MLVAAAHLLLVPMRTRLARRAPNNLKSLGARLRFSRIGAASLHNKTCHHHLQRDRQYQQHPTTSKLQKMDLRGQRFTVNLSDDEEDETPSATRIPSSAVPSITSAFIADVKEREVGAPSAPKLKTTPNGFPEHKKRPRVSAFKQQRANASAKAAPDSVNAFALPGGAKNDTKSAQSGGMTEREQIDIENNAKLAAMSSEEIEEERRELLASLDPTLIERLLKRANLDTGRGDTGIDPPADVEDKHTPKGEGGAEPNDVKYYAHGGATPAPIPTGKRVKASKTVTFEEDEEPENPINLQAASKVPSIDPQDLPEGSIHFPNAPAAPELDPNDPSFLENLHSKYFPNLPADPSKLAWMAPLPTHGSVADQDSPYYPGNESLTASALRFDFRGSLLPPRIARAMPVSKGLHHHGEAPEAAGYTVPELARLARSAFPAQRCISFQTLGRLLYKLGRGEFGGRESEITLGLWKCVEEGKILQTLQEASSAEGGHQGSKVYAIEAVWLWQKGGGKLWKAT